MRKGTRATARKAVCGPYKSQTVKLTSNRLQNSQVRQARTLNDPMIYRLVPRLTDWATFPYVHSRIDTFAKTTLANRALANLENLDTTSCSTGNMYS